MTLLEASPVEQMLPILFPEKVTAIIINVNVSIINIIRQNILNVVDKLVIAIFNQV